MTDSQLPSPDLLKLQVAWARRNDYVPRLFWGPSPLTVPSLWLVLEGDGRVEGADEVVDVSAGDWLWFPPCAARRIYIGESGMSWLSAGIVTRFGERDFLVPLAPRLWRPDAVEAARGEVFLRELIAASDAGNIWERDGLARALSGWLWRGAHDVQSALNWPTWLRHAMQRIERDPSVSVAALSEEAHFSAAQFRRLWQQHLGQSPQQTVVARRLELARGVLEREDWALEDVAHHSGFSTSQALTRLFKAEFGLAPLAWRRAVRRGKQE